MKKAFANAHGQFREKAEHAGESTQKFAHNVLAGSSHASTKTKRQAALAERGMEANKKTHKQLTKSLYRRD